MAEAREEAEKLRVRVRQHERQIERLATVVVEAKGHREVEDLVTELIDFGGFRGLPIALQLAIESVAEAYGIAICRRL